MSIKSGVEILRKCESDLRQCVAETAAVGDYDSVLRITEWARQIAEMANCDFERPSPNRTFSQRITSKSEASRSKIDKVSSAKNDQKSSRLTVKKGRKKTAQADYPKFVRQKDELVKIGWSRRDKKEYQHRAPLRVVSLLSDQLLEVGAGGKLFTTDELFPLQDRAESSEVPVYQSYLCLAWLRGEGLVVSEGRQGYRIADPKHLRDAWEQHWNKLPDSRA